MRFPRPRPSERNYSDGHGISGAHGAGPPGGGDPGPRSPGPGRPGPSPGGGIPGPGPPGPGAGPGPHGAHGKQGGGGSAPETAEPTPAAAPRTATATSTARRRVQRDDEHCDDNCICLLIDRFIQRGCGTRGLSRGCVPRRPCEFASGRGDVDALATSTSPRCHGVENRARQNAAGTDIHHLAIAHGSAVARGPRTDSRSQPRVALASPPADLSTLITHA
jgi:hypothetical protein